MNTKSGSNRFLRLYQNSSFFHKMLWMFVLCGFLPMIGMLVFFYYSTSNLLLRQSYENVKQSMTTTASGLNQALQPYGVLMNILENDKELNLLLGMNYYNNSYSDLAYYADHTLDDMMIMYPELEGIHIYSNNSTLPKDDYYFYPTKQLSRERTTHLEETGERLIIELNEKSQNSLMFLSRMNYLVNGSARNFLEFQVSLNLIQNQLTMEQDDHIFTLVDYEGDVLTDSRKKYTGTNVGDYLVGWEDMKCDQVMIMDAVDGKSYICMKTDLGYHMYLMMLVDRASVLSDALIMPLRMIAFFVVILVILMVLAFVQSRMLEERLNRILWGMGEIGAGRFQEKIEPMGEDEFGRIADAVNQTGDHLDQLIKDNYEKQLIIKSTELNLLQEQINPHFLYNALGVISSLSIKEQGKETVKSIRFLADFYRISLNKGRKVITVQEEVALLNNYMKIQLLRFSDLVEIDYEIAPEVESYYTIKLLLQPLVENAIHHAREEEMFLSIHVRAYAQGDRVCFDVSDNGMGIEAKKLKVLQEALLRQEEGFGLKNVDKRIKLAYGQDYGVTVYSTWGKGTRIHLEIPKMETRETGVSE